MPASKRNDKNKKNDVSRGDEPVDGKVTKKRKNASAKKSMATFYHGGCKPGNRKEITYNTISNVFRDVNNNNNNDDEDDDAARDQETTGRARARRVRIKKNAKAVLKNLLMVILRSIVDECKWICNLENLHKIREKDVYTQQRLMYPISEQDSIVNYGKNALKNYVASTPVV